MGPCFISTEDFARRSIQIGPCGTLQWGRASSARKTLASCGPSTRNHRPASMGPCFISTEDARRRTTAILKGDMLQWGRASSARKTNRPLVVRHLRDPLQWGRASSARKTLAARPSDTTPAGFNGAVLHQHGRRVDMRHRVEAEPRCFNGAVLHQHGRLAISSTEAAIAIALQWGRASSARKTPRACRDHCRPSIASMGPCFISTEDAGTWLIVAFERRRFNGAVLHQHGRHGICGPMVFYFPASMGPCFISTEDAKFCSTFGHESGALQWGRASSARKTLELAGKSALYEELQWGRASSARKTIQRLVHNAGCQPASMGPCFISTEDVDSRGDNCRTGICFNGAVLHQHGRQQSHPRLSARQLALQWGRASSARKTNLRLVVSIAKK